MLPEEFGRRAECKDQETNRNHQRDIEAQDVQKESGDNGVAWDEGFEDVGG